MVELGEEFGSDGPAVLDWLSCEAKAQNDGGWVKGGHKSVARGCFVDVVTVGHVLSHASQIGALDELSGENGRFSCRISGWQADHERGRAAVRKAEERARREGLSSAPEPDPGDGQAVTDGDLSQVVTPSHGKSLKGEHSIKKASPSLSPSQLDDAQSKLQAAQVRRVFDEWVQATERNPARTKLTPDRCRRIEKALASHGLADCLAAVGHIGQDSWARGQNDRGRRFDDIEHALGKAERIERWRDWTTRSISVADQRGERRSRRGAALQNLMANTEAAV